MWLTASLWCNSFVMRNNQLNLLFMCYDGTSGKIEWL